MNDAAETFDDVLNAYLDMIRAGTVPTTGGDNAGSVPTPRRGLSVWVFEGLGWGKSCGDTPRKTN